MLHVPPVILGIVPEIEIDDGAVDRQPSKRGVLRQQAFELLPNQLWQMNELQFV